MKIAGKRVGNIGYNRAELTRADLTQADLTRGRVDPHSSTRATKTNDKRDCTKRTFEYHSFLYRKQV